MGRQDRRCESPSTRAQRSNGGRVFLGAAAPVITGAVRGGSGHAAATSGRGAGGAGAIQMASRDAMAELRATIGILRRPEADQPEDGEVPPAPAPGLGQLSDLVDSTSGVGPRVELAMDGEPRPLRLPDEHGVHRPGRGVDRAGPGVAAIS